MDIHGKNAIVVGGASGLGLATAEALRHRGAAVAILGRAESAGAQAAERLGRRHRFHRNRSRAAASRRRPWVSAHHRDNCGGGATLGGLTLSDSGPHSLDAFRAVVDLNTVATFNISRLAALHMSRNKPEDDERGAIISTASLAACGGQAGLVA